MSVDAKELSLSIRDQVLAMEQAAKIDIMPGTVLTDDSAIALVIAGPLDRALIMISELKFDGLPSTLTYPFDISFGLGIGSMCDVDRNRLISGPAPDLISLKSATDRRAGMLYHAANVLAGKFYLWAATPAGSGKKFTARVSVVADHKGGGGEVAVLRGDVFG